MALCDASSLRRHIMRRHKAVYDALDACKPATVVITDERRHRAIGKKYSVDYRFVYFTKFHSMVQ